MTKSERNILEFAQKSPQGGSGLDKFLSRHCAFVSEIGADHQVTDCQMIRLQQLQHHSKLTNGHPPKMQANLTPSESPRTPTLLDASFELLVYEGECHGVLHRYARYVIAKGTEVVNSAVRSGRVQMRAICTKLVAVDDQIIGGDVDRRL